VGILVRWYNNQQQHSHLKGDKGDIVEALQCVKCALHNNLLFHKLGPSSLGEFETDELELELELESGQAADGDGTDKQGWDDLLLEEAYNDLETQNSKTALKAIAQAKARPRPSPHEGLGLA
jgi:hypothetical protein